MNAGGILLAFLSGAFNGLFTAPLKLQTRWKWENTWLVFIIVACLAMPIVIVGGMVPNWRHLFESAPRGAVAIALGFGFAWGFGAISFGQSVDRLGVSIANSLVIGLSSALGSLVPLLMDSGFRLSLRTSTLLGGVAAFLIGVVFCGSAGLLRDRQEAKMNQSKAQLTGYVFAVTAGVMSAIFNIGFSMALPIAATGVRMGLTQTSATNCIWLLILGAGSIPNIGYCCFLMAKNRSASLLMGTASARPFVLAILMGLLWGGSIFLYGAAVARLGEFGPSIGWPLSLAVGLLVANAMGLLLREWKGVSPKAVHRMLWGLSFLTAAIVLCAASTRITA